MMGQGGPFIPYHPDMRSEEEEDTLRLSLTQRLDRWETLRGVFVSLPLVPPVTTYTLTSKFGVRSDPFNGLTSRHAGIDLAEPYTHPSPATAARQLVFARRRPRPAPGVMPHTRHGLTRRHNPPP